MSRLTDPRPDAKWVRVLRSMVLLLALVLSGACGSIPTMKDLLEPVTPGSQEDPLEFLTFSGNSTFSDGRLRELLVESVGELARTGLRRAAVDDAAFELAAFYQDQGFPDVLVEARWSGNAVEQEEVAVLDIDEGQRIVVNSVEVRGNEGFTDEELRTLLSGTRSGLLGTGLLFYSRSSALAMAERARLLYVDAGWLDAEIEMLEPEKSEDGRGVELQYVVTEHDRTLLGQVEYVGELVAPREQLDELAEPFVGKPWNVRLAWELRGRIAELYGNLGRPATRVDFEFLRPPGSAGIELTFTIEVGPEVRVSEIVLPEGLETRDNTVRELISLREGELYRLEEQRKSLQQLYGSGLFESVDLRLGETVDGTAPLLVELKETTTLETYVEPGYGSYEGPRLGFGAREQNFLGRGLTLRGEATAGFLAQQVDAGLYDPRLFGSDLDFDFSIYATSREEPSFQREELGASALTGLTIDRHWRVTFGYQLKQSDASDVEVTDPDTLAALEDVKLSSFSISPTYDSRDNFFLPTRGTYGTSVLQYAGSGLGSELDFIRIRATVSKYFSLNEQTVIAASVRTGLTWTFADTEEIPLQERFFNGGENSVRSFRQDELGPLDSNENPLGGEAFNLFSIELRRTLWNRLQGAAFFDTGNVVSRVEDQLRFDDFRSAIGLGLRWVLPIGPVRLDAGWNPDARGPEDDFAVHLSVGLAF